jgi:hypothetical protein
MVVLADDGAPAQLNARPHRQPCRDRQIEIGAEACADGREIFRIQGAGNIFEIQLGNAQRNRYANRKNRLLVRHFRPPGVTRRPARRKIGDECALLVGDLVPAGAEEGRVRPVY